MGYINTYTNKLSYDNISDTIIDHTPFTGADDNWLAVLHWEVLQTTVCRGVAQLV